MDDYERWKIELGVAVKMLGPGRIVKLQKRLVFLTLGAAVEVAPGRFRRLTGVIFLTPVDTGRARASWGVSIGPPELGKFPPPGEYSNPNPLDLTGGLAGLGPYQEVWVTSNLPYIRVLEYGGYPNPARGGEGKVSGGYSKQAPRGMVRVTFDQVKRVAREITA